MKRLVFVFLLALLPSLVAAAPALSESTKTSVVFIANYNNDKEFLGWGSGFFVDEGIVVTNKHVIAAGDWYAVYATTPEGKVDFGCRKNITKSDVKINLDDDVAYIRVFLPCDHDTLLFAPDPEIGDPLWIIGYPFRGTVSASLNILITSGSVLPTTIEGWMRTDARLDSGNSGGPVVNGSAVIGVAVAKGVDENGDFVAGYFIPASVALNGLLYANDSRFAYTPQSSVSSSRGSSLSSGASVSPISSSFRSASRSSAGSSLVPFPDVPPSLPGYDAIIALRERGVISGYADGRYHPEAGINRAEFVKILVAGFRPGAVRAEHDCFSDVADEWFAPYVCAAKRLGWIGGYPDPSAGSGQALQFRPAQQVNRAEGVKIVVEAFDDGTKGVEKTPSDVRPGTWFYPYVVAGVGIGIISPDELFHPERDLTREHAAMWIYGAE